MANIKSKEKRILTNEKRRMRNKAVKSSLKTAVRKYREAAATGDVTAAESHLRAASRELDKAATKGVIHKNQAAQRKSKLAASYNKLASAA
ncbi:30S ribosomal protein S20 [Glycomyces buryatensis]|uniref:Small ribosomal subunit protein bS20 n=1 Tax=Glycomyces buryatensis TaxID=2570927 RepID=A0A4S8QE09_9ACTN|nr:30S ribosomal protein S20 [Glycomyces buryatensis]THV41145.1 30S ribosomal protein S20 [Glycomyces buryatensis]